MRTRLSTLNYKPAVPLVFANDNLRVAASAHIKSIIGAILLVSTLLTIACSQKNPEFEPETEYTASDQAVVETSSGTADLSAIDNKPSAKLKVENLSTNSESSLNSQAANLGIAGKTLVVSAAASFKVEDVVKSSTIIENLTYQQGGYVASSSISNTENDSRIFTQADQDITLTTYQRQADMILRIPKANVNKFLQQVQQQVAFLNEQSFSAQDVTLDIYREQLAGQLNNELTDELSQQRLNSTTAKDQNSNVAAISATYRARQQQEYARLQQMDIADKVKYSTITLSFTQPDVSYKETTQNLDRIMKSERPSFGVQVNQALKEGWETLREVALTLVRLWWLVIVITVFYGLYRLVKKLYRQLRQRKKLKKARLNQAKGRPKYQPENKVDTINPKDDGRL